MSLFTRKKKRSTTDGYRYLSKFKHKHAETLASWTTNAYRNTKGGLGTSNHALRFRRRWREWRSLGFQSLSGFSKGEFRRERETERTFEEREGRGVWGFSKRERVKLGKES